LELKIDEQTHKGGKRDPLWLYDARQGIVVLGGVTCGLASLQTRKGSSIGWVLCLYLIPPLIWLTCRIWARNAEEISEDRFESVALNTVTINGDRSEIRRVLHGAQGAFREAKRFRTLPTESQQHSLLVLVLLILPVVRVFAHASTRELGMLGVVGYGIVGMSYVFSRRRFIVLPGALVVQEIRVLSVMESRNISLKGGTMRADFTTGHLLIRTPVEHLEINLTETLSPHSLVRSILAASTIQQVADPKNAVSRVIGPTPM